MRLVVTSRMSWSPGNGLSQTTFTKIPVGANARPPAMGRKSAALAGSVVTLVMSTPLEKENANPVKTSEHGSAVEQNGISTNMLVITIWVSPTEIVDPSSAPSTKFAGMVGVALSVESTSTSQLGSYGGRTPAAGHWTRESKNSRKRCWFRRRLAPPAPERLR